MHFSAFLTTILEQKFFLNINRIGFKGKEYSPLFFSYFLKKIADHHAITIQRISLLDIDQEAVKTQLNMSFLGDNQLYWFGNLAELDAKKKRMWIAYLNAYSGPHKVAFFIDDASLGDDNDLIQLPETVDAKLYSSLQTFLKPDFGNTHKKFTKKLFDFGSKLSLDRACIILEYQTVVGMGIEDFFSEWLEKIVPSEKSLFVLSQYFFAKSVKDFMSLWQRVRTEYPEVFWVTFWSEQVWRASYVIKLYQEKKIAEAKKISFRLPFSFVQRDWRKSNVTELRNAHNFMYGLDYKIKNGASDAELDLFFTKFFSGDFA